MKTSDPFRPLISEDAIETRISELARQISLDYRDKDELILIGVLRGCFMFLADLCRRLTVQRRVDFIAAASYSEHPGAGGDVRLVMDTRLEIRGRHVLLVDDILDTGHTLDFLRSLLIERQPVSLRTCVLLRKPEADQGLVKADYWGFDIPNTWVVGYGLDHQDEHRALPFVAQLGSSNPHR